MATAGGAYRRQNERDFRSDVLSYRGDTPFSGALYRACGLEEPARQALRHGPIRITDAMSGPGKVWKDVIGPRYTEYMRAHTDARGILVTFNDSRAEAVDPMAGQGYATLVCDVREIGRRAASTGFHPQEIIVVRYGIKELPRDDQAMALHEIHGFLEEGGRVVLGEIYSEGERDKAGFQTVHGMKHFFAGRNISVEGALHIPTISEWKEYLTSAGFEVADEYTHYDTSPVTPVKSWSGQFQAPKGSNEEEEILAKLNWLVKQTATGNPDFARVSKAHEENGVMSFEFPIVVLAGVKRG
jgi:hypothetical protein